MSGGVHEVPAVEVKFTGGASEGCSSSFRDLNSSDVMRRVTTLVPRSFFLPIVKLRATRPPPSGAMYERVLVVLHCSGLRYSLPASMGYRCMRWPGSSVWQSSAARARGPYISLIV